MAVTIREVASAAGVSVSTVSRAFTAPDQVQPRTRQRILDAAAELGYSPNPAARSLRGGGTGTLGLIVPDIANPFFPPLLRQVQQTAEEAGLAVLLGDSDESADREARLAARLGPQVDGFVLASSRLPDGAVRRLAEGRPLVLVNRDVAGIPRVLVDSSGGMTEAVALLARLGHGRLAYLAGPRDSWSDQQRRATLAEAAPRAGLALEVVEVGRPSHEAGRDAVSAVLRSGATAAIAFDDVVAQGLLAGLELRGVSVPGDFSLVGCDDTLASLTTPAMSSVSAASGSAGRAAARLLTAMLAGEGGGAERVCVATHLVVRATTGPAPRP